MVLDARPKAALLLFVAHFQPEFDKLDAGIDNVVLDAGADLEKALVLRLGAKAHHVFYARPVIPAAIEDDDLTRRREVLHVALQINLVFSRSDGVGRATTRKTRGLTRSVIALIAPPFPAASRPSKTTMMRSP